MIKKSIFSVLLMAMLMLFATPYAFGVVWGNDSPNGFEDPIPGGTGSTGTPSGSGLLPESTKETGIDYDLDYYVVQGAGHFLRAYADILVLSNRIELGGLCVSKDPDFKGLLDSASSQMNAAGNMYVKLKQQAAVTPYKPEVIDMLARFDYAGFQDAYRLNGTVFQEVIKYLKKGDIRGVYGHMSGDIENLMGGLDTIRRQMDTQGCVEIRDVWQLNQEAAQSYLFGQYVAMVFGHITESLR